MLDGSPDEARLLVDSGDTFFRSAHPLPFERPQFQLKARFLAEAYDRLGYDFVVPGERDFALGRGVVEGLANDRRWSWLAANVLVGTKTLFPASALVERGGLRIAVVGGITDVYGLRAAGRELYVDALDRRLAAEVKRLRPLVDLLVVVAHVELDHGEDMVRAIPGIDVFVGGHGRETTTEPRRIGDCLLVEARSRGRLAGRLRLVVPSGEGRSGLAPLDSMERNGTCRVYYENACVPIPVRLPDRPDLLDLVRRYRKEVVELAKSLSANEGKRVAPPAAGRTYWGIRVCRQCHEGAAQTWVKTAHGHAFRTLEGKGQDLDLDCVGCHTVGYCEEGGYRLATDAVVFRDVQCESCHGPGSEHGTAVYAERARKKETCLKCHDQEHSPTFDYERYMQAIRGPGHGASPSSP